MAKNTKFKFSSYCCLSTLLLSSCFPSATESKAVLIDSKSNDHNHSRSFFKEDSKKTSIHTELDNLTITSR